MEEIEGKGYDQKTLYMQDMTWPECSVIWKNLVITDNGRGALTTGGKYYAWKKSTHKRKQEMTP
jgi:hypothetical protein